MDSYRDLLDTLAVQSKNGDAEAKVRLRQELEPQIGHMVPPTLRAMGRRTRLSRQILAEARRVGLSAAMAPSEQRELLIRRVARHVCNSYIAELCSSQQNHRPLVDTVNNGANPSLRMAS